jgi:predicted dehydrogenase
MKVVIAGLGSLGKRWTELVHQSPNVQLSAFVDPLIDAGGIFPWLANYPNVPQAQTLDGLDNNVEALIVTASSPSHAEIVQRGLELGLHVLVEKPFATRVADAEALVELARKNERILMVSQNYRFFPGVQTLRAMKKSGDLGSVRAVIGQFWCDWPGKPYQHQMSHPMGLEMAVHHFDLVRAIFEGNPLSGLVREWNPERSPYQMGGALEALFTMQSRESVFPFLYSGSLVTQGVATPWGGRWRFEFDRGTVVVDTIDRQYGLFQAHDGTYRFLSAFAEESMAFDKSFNHFSECIRSGQEPWCSGADNLETLRMVLDYTAPETFLNYAKDRS